jgi:hypothetical protein
MADVRSREHPLTLRHGADPVREHGEVRHGRELL